MTAPALTPPADRLLTNRHGMRMAINPLGATWTSCRVPLADGTHREVLMGSHDLATMLAGGAFLGASIGRYAGRIAGGRFQGHQLDINQPPHCLHGGRQNFSRRLWQWVDTESNDRQITLQLHSPAGDQGFPGNLTAKVCYRLDEDNGLSVIYSATTDAATPCNLTNHAYFNLNGGDLDNGLDQYLRIVAERYQPVGPDGIPDRPPRSVAGTGFDFRAAKLLSQDYRHDADQQQVDGYDHSFLLDNGGRLALAAELCSADGRVAMQLFTDQPALHLYTGQALVGTEKRDGSAYANNAGIALESQFPPDSPSHGRAILQPGHIYRHVSRYVFCTEQT
ncbi:MAG: galactose-1-epimerase [Lautropia sp.]|nr:galactose-1-epimerase [Lautropia sp.]